MSHAAAWYQHFWPWFIVGLLGVSVLASLSTVYVAYSLGDLEVVEGGFVVSPTDPSSLPKPTVEP